MYEFPPVYTVFQWEYLNTIPVILVGKVLERCAPVGEIHPSRWDESPRQLWRVRVRVENVLQGKVSAGEQNIYYFVYMGNLGTSDSGLTDLAAGDRRIFFLQRDNGNLRTICDGGHSCAPKVFTGAHPNYRLTDDRTINDAIYDILLTRGEGATDRQLLTAIRFVGPYGDQYRVQALERLVRTESSEVARDACSHLQHGFNPPHSCPPERGDLPGESRR